MQIKVYATLRDILGASRFDVPLAAPATVGDVLRRLVAEHPALQSKLWDEREALTGYITVFLNGRSVSYLRGLETPVSEADTLSLFPPVGGG